MIALDLMLMNICTTAEQIPATMNQSLRTVQFPKHSSPDAQLNPDDAYKLYSDDANWRRATKLNSKATSMMVHSILCRYLTYEEYHHREKVDVQSSFQDGRQTKDPRNDSKVGRSCIMKYKLKTSCSS